MSIVLTSGVLVTWLTLALVFSAIGGLFFGRIGRIESSWEHLYYSVFAGIALTVVGLTVWHFFFPISAAFGPFLALSVVAIVVERRWFRPLLQIRRHLPFALGALALTAWTANHSLAGGGMDDYNYEFQAVRWFFEHPVIPGLANLHGRLGFNNSHHLLAALISAGYWAGHVNHILNSFIVALVLVHVLFAFVKIAGAERRPPVMWLHAAVLFAPAIGLVLFGVFGPAISTLKADLFVSAGVILLSCVFLRFAGAQAGTQEYGVSAATAILVGGLLTTVKLSAAAFCAVIVVAVLVRVAKDTRTSLLDRASRRLIAASGIVGMLLICGFLARGVVLSGYPLFPSSVFGLDVDWRVPPGQVEAVRVFIKTWSQLRPTYDFALVANQEWLRGWLNSLLVTERLGVVLPLVLMTVLSSGLWTSSRRGFAGDPDNLPSRTLVRPQGWWAVPVLWGASVMALMVWFTQAPAPRFAALYFWIPLAGAIATIARADGPRVATRPVIGVAVGCAAGAAYVVQLLLDYSNVERLHHPGVLAVVVFGALWAISFLAAQHQPRVLLALCIVLGISQTGERAAAHAWRGRTDDISAMAWYNVQALPREPVFEHTVRHTHSGLTLYVSQSASFHTPIPNTRYFNPYLELRTPHDVRGGFRNRADASVGYGYTVDYVRRPNADAETVVPAGQ